MNAIIKAITRTAAGILIKDDKEAPLTPVGLLTLAVLFMFLVISAWYAISAWNKLAGVEVSGAGWTFLVLGVLVTVALGAGLMGLVFYSSRHDLDQ